MPCRPSLPARCAFLLVSLLAACDSKDKPTSAPPAAPPVANFVTAICVDDKCAAIDQAGTLKIPFDNPFDEISPTLLTDTVLVAKDDKWYFPDAKTGKTGEPFADGIRVLLPGYVGFRRGGKWGVIDAAGHDVQPPRFDSVDGGGENDFIAYGLDGKMGLMDAHARVLTKPVFDTIDLDGSASRTGHLVMAVRDHGHWVVNLQDGSQKKVAYDRLRPMSDEHMVADDPDGTLHGLADAKGDLVVPLQYPWLGDPAGGLVAFRQGTSRLCGYLDDTGKVVIPAHLVDCGTFGKKGAIAGTEVESGGAKATKYGLIDRSDHWAVEPTYDSGGPAGRTVLGMLKPVPGLASIGRRSNLLLTDDGIFDTDTGRVSIPPTYQVVGVLTADRFVFSRHDSPKLPFSFMGQTDTTPAVGVMTSEQKVLADAMRYVDIVKDRTEPYLRGVDGAANRHEALLDLDGHVLIDMQWNRLLVDKPLGVVFGYTANRAGGVDTLTLRAAYDLTGKPIFSVMTLPCGAEQLIDAAGKPVWPLDPNPYCTNTEQPLR